MLQRNLSIPNGLSVCLHYTVIAIDLHTIMESGQH